MSKNTISHREILNMAGPMIIANISVPLLGMIDTAVVGHLDSAHYLGGVAIGAMIFTFLFWSFGFLRMVTTGLTAQAHGKGDKQDLLQTLVKSIILACVIAILILLLQFPIKQIAFALIESSEQVQQQAKIYFDIRIWSTPAILINYALLGWFIGKQASQAALLLVLAVTTSNMLLDIVFVVGLGMTVDGVAIASVIAEYIGLAVGLILLKKQDIAISHIFNSVKNSSLSVFKLEWLMLHANTFIRTLCLLFCFAFFTSQSAKHGDVVLAANSVLLNFLTLMAYVLDGFANATEVLCGKAIGLKNRVMLRQALKLNSYWAFAVAVCFSSLYYLFGSQIISLLTSIDEVIFTAEQYLPWLIVMPIIGVWAYLLDGLFIGATRSKEMRNTMLFSTFICYLPCWYLTQEMGNTGLWLSLLVMLAARGISQSFYLPRIMAIKQ